MPAELAQSKNIFICKLCVAETAYANRFGNEKAVFRIIFNFAEEQIAYSIRLQRIDDIHLKALVEQKTV